MFASIRKHRMDPEQVAILLRKYYEQDREMRRLEADLESVDLPIDFDNMSPMEALDELLTLLDEVEQLQEEVPEKCALNHQADLDHLLLLLKNEYNKVESLTSARDASDQILPVTEEQTAMMDSARRIRDKIHEIEILKEELREKLEEVRILEQLPSQGSSNRSKNKQ